MEERSSREDSKNLNIELNMLRKMKMGIGMEASSAVKEIQRLENTSDFLAFKELLLEKNKYINLTRIVSDSDYSVKNIEDSLLPLFLSQYYNLELLSHGGSLLDIGVGGGFPLFPVYFLAREKEFQNSFTGIDSIQKKINAIREIALELEADIVFTAGRAEELARQKEYREKFDIVISRAVAALPTLLEYASPFVKEGGIFVAYKGADVDEELKSAKSATKKLSLKLLENIKYSLSNDLGDRALLVYRKNSPISAIYPRSVGTPKKKPL